jgi:hypothetical protein
MVAFAAPLIPGTRATWESFIGELNWPRKADFDDINSRYGPTQHSAYLQENPDRRTSSWSLSTGQEPTAS